MGLLLSLQVHAAGEPGWYVGVEGFATQPGDAEGTSAGREGTAPVPGSEAVNCLLPPLLNIIDDVGLLGLCVIGEDLPETPGTPGTEAVAAQRFAYDFKPGFGGGLLFGYAFENGLRPELAFNYSTADVDTFTLKSVDGTPVNLDPVDAEGDVSTLRLMLNAWYDLDLGRVLPYLGGGIGAQRTDTDLPGVVDGDDTTFTFQGGAGLGFLLTDYLKLALDYRYVAADNPQYQSAFGTSLESEYESHNLGLSMHYAFGTGGGTDSDGDGVPDRHDKCPNTPQGVTVYSDGCPTDLDGDGVPDYLDKCPGTPKGTMVNADGCPLDSDGDGVADMADQCPGTPPGVKVDVHGCPLDSDGDGVPDYLDQCPGTKPGTRVDANGCDFVDSDGDGVPDALDKCPDSPPGQKVGPDGCPLDSDGDGIPDELDDCPNTPPGLKVLPDGCAPVGDCRRPRPGEPVDARGCALDRRFVLRGVKFEFDSDRLTEAAQLVLDEVAITLASYPDIRLDVEGHTDSLGTDAYNLGLSERRANSVKRYLGGKGVDTGRMRPVGYGEAVPIDTNDTDAGRENNRRVEFKVTDG